MPNISGYCAGITCFLTTRRETLRGYTMGRLYRVVGSTAGSMYNIRDGFTGDKKSWSKYIMVKWKEKTYSSSAFGANWPPKGAGMSWAEDGGDAFFAQQINGGIGTAQASAYNKAYAKFKSEAYDQAATLTALSERRKTCDMLTSRLLKVAIGAAHLVNRDLKGFLNHFGVKPKKKDRRTRSINGKSFTKRPVNERQSTVGDRHQVSKRLADYWLEYWMGWAPTVGDIYTLTKTMGEPYPDNSEIKVGSKSAPWSAVTSKTSSTVKYDWEASCSVTVQLRGLIRVTNPSLFDVEKAGLINPAVTALETVPMSFIVEWFVNVKQLLSTVTDFAGLEIYDLWISSKLVGETSISWQATIHNGRALHTRECVHFRRVPKTDGLPMITPEVRSMKQTAERAATVASLAVKCFLGDRKAAKKVLQMGSSQLKFKI